MDKNEALEIFIITRIKQLRKLNGLSQENLSIAADLDIKYISKLENLYYSPKFDTLEKIINALNISYSEFFQFDIQANQSILEELLLILSSLPPEEQEIKIKAITQLLK